MTLAGFGGGDKKETYLDEPLTAVGRNEEGGEGARAGVEAAWMRVPGAVSKRGIQRQRTEDDRVGLPGHRRGRRRERRR